MTPIVVRIIAGLSIAASDLIGFTSASSPSLAAQVSSGVILKVGPVQTYKKPSDALAAAGDGDTIEIDAGTYDNDPLCIRQNNLTFRGVGNGYAHMSATPLPGQSLPPTSRVNVCSGKGIWVVKGNNTTVENIEFSGAKVDSANGAGIRQEGRNLTVRHSYFHHNQNGILTSTDLASNIIIENSEFAFNGAGDGQSHNMYIGPINSLTLRNSYSHDARVGHNVKTRAHTNYIIGNRITDEAGNPSYDIDINGGIAYLIGNIIQKSVKADNLYTAVNFITRDYVAAFPTLPNELYVANNTMVSDVGRGSFIRIRTDSDHPVTVKVVNNLFVGDTAYVPLTVDYGNPVPGLSTMAVNNLQIPLTATDLTNRAGYDYHLTADSQAINAGIDPGAVNGVSLMPTTQYVHPENGETRTILGPAIDIGAYEFTGVPTRLYPAPNVSISATPAQTDTSSMLAWSSNADSCTASGGWSGARPASGTFNTGPIRTPVTYTLTCTNAGGPTSQSVVVSPPPDVTITLATPFARVPVGTGSWLNWSTAHAASCTASGNWSVPVGLAGGHETGPLMSNAAFALSCVGLNGSSATKSVTVIVTDAITTLPLSQTFALHLDQKELGSVSNGRSITPAVGPSGVLRLRGKGIVNFASTANDQGVSFGPGGQQNAHSAAYDFPLSATEFQSLLSEAGGEIDATLVSKFDYAARAKGVPAQNNDHHLETIVSAHNGAKPVLDLTFDQWTHLTFMAQAPGADPFSYNVPAGLEDVLFGKDKVLKLRLTWDGSAERLYMNNVLVASHAYTRQPIAWGTKSDLVVGAAPHPVYGPGFRALMDTLDELSISQVVSGTTTPSTTIRY